MESEEQVVPTGQSQIDDSKTQSNPVESNGESPPIVDLENPQVIIEGEMKLRTSLNFSHYLTTKAEFETKKVEFETKKVEFEAANITQEQQNSLDKHKLDYDLIGKLEQKPLPENESRNFDNAIFVGFYNTGTGTTSGPDVFLDTKGYFITSNDEVVDPAKEKAVNGERIPTFIENEGYRFVPVFMAAVKDGAQWLLKPSKGGKSKKRVKKNSKNKSKRRYKK
jgi:hypothetical protein